MLFQSLISLESQQWYGLQYWQARFAEKHPYERRAVEMNDHVKGKEFGGALEHLRQVSKVWLPKMADEYGTGARAMTKYLEFGGNSYVTSAEAYSTADFLAGDGHKFMYKKWTELADLFTAALGHTANTYWFTAQVMGWALEDFEKQDAAAADEISKHDGLKETTESGGQLFDEFDGKYKPVELPDYKDPSNG